MTIENSSLSSFDSTPGYDSVLESHGSFFQGFQKAEISFPNIHLPPNNTVITSFRVLSKHLQQNSLLFDAFQKRFRIIPVEYQLLIHVADEGAVLKFIKLVETMRSQYMHFFNVSLELESFNFALGPLWKINQLKQSDGIGTCILIEIFYKAILSKFNTETAEDVGQQYGNDFLMAINQLQFIDYIEMSSITDPVTFHQALADAFDSEYYDPFELVSDYVGQLRQNMKNWVAKPMDFNAPYTNVVNASMMGKSRLIKEIAMKIPTVYICLRERNDGYPIASPKNVKDIFTSPNYRPELLAESNEENILRSFVVFFLALLQHLGEWCKSYDPKDETQLAKLRKQLWLILAEPQKSGEDTDGFWGKVSEKRGLSKEKRTSELISEMEKVWNNLNPYLSCTVNGVSESLLLIVWDEARILVNTSMDGRRSDTSLVNIFRLLRRALRRMGRYGTPPVLRIFSLFIDTSSRLGDIQPRNDSDSSRAPIVVPGGPSMFRPIVLMPSLDAAARTMVITCQPNVVIHPDRLMRLGRVAWHIMQKKKTPVDLLELAVSKLFRTARILLPKLFASQIRDDVNLKMLACLGPRLAIQPGPYVTATKQLVASHMMTLERVGVNHDHLETRYLSEPILAEAAAEGTANYGWAKPLEALVSEMRHGIVDKGCRGEFITKALLCIAVEDAQREAWKATTSHIGWQFTQSITVEQFLNSLFRSPLATEHIISASTDEPTFYSSGKRKVRTDNEPHITTKTEKLKNMSFDDSTSDDEEVRADNSDGVPTPDDSFVKYIDNEAELHKIFGPKMQEDARSNSLKSLLYGHIFFNHFIRTETILRPSLLMEAWNRGAAIMTRMGTTGVDFVIPVMVSGKAEGKFGPFIGPWSDEQEEAADSVISYILIQTKHRATAYPSDAREALTKCIPITMKPRAHDLLPNFTKHMPRNHYISILMEFGVEKQGEKRIQMMNVVDYAVLDKKREEINEKSKIIKKKRHELKDPTQSKQLEDLEKKFEKEKNDYDIECAWLPIREKQLPIIAYGLTQDTYKCLENRPNVVRMLHQLAQPYLNSLRGLPSNQAAALRAGRHVMIHPLREYTVSNSKSG